MSEAVLLNNLTITFQEVNKVLAKAKRAALEYEVFVSDMQHRLGLGKKVADVNSYFSKLVRQNEKHNNDENFR